MRRWTNGRHAELPFDAHDEIRFDPVDPSPHIDGLIEAVVQAHTGIFRG